MSSKKIQQYRKKLLRVERERSRILSELLSVKSMLKGSYALIYTKCGKDNCWCKNEKGHPHSRITWSQKGKGFTRRVPLDQIAWVQEVTKNYRNFRSLRRKLNSLALDSKKLLDKIENDLTENTRKSKNFLEIKSQNRKKNPPAVPKKKSFRKNTNG